MPCAACGVEFVVRAGRPGRRRRYCSQACRTRAYRDARTPDGAQLCEEILRQLRLLGDADPAAVRARLSSLDADTLTCLARAAARLSAAVLPQASVVLAGESVTVSDDGPGAETGAQVVALPLPGEDADQRVHGTNPHEE